jgi:hypothetical protein
MLERRLKDCRILSLQLRSEKGNIIFPCYLFSMASVALVISLPKINGWTPFGSMRLNLPPFTDRGRKRERARCLRSLSVHYSSLFRLVSTMVNSVAENVTGTIGTVLVSRRLCLIRLIASSPLDSEGADFRTSVLKQWCIQLIPQGESN